MIRFPEDYSRDLGDGYKLVQDDYASNCLTLTKDNEEIVMVQYLFEHGDEIFDDTAIVKLQFRNNYYVINDNLHEYGLVAESYEREINITEVNYIGD
jgi:hypothetical protein